MGDLVIPVYPTWGTDAIVVGGGDGRIQTGHVFLTNTDFTTAVRGGPSSNATDNWGI